MTRCTIHRFVWGNAVAVLVFSASAATALAGEREVQAKLPAEILLSSTQAPHEESSWISPDFHIHKKRGIAYTRNLKMGEKGVQFSIQGPVMSKKSLGLEFEFRF